jgi:mono/diheme cytochrome c family protein
MRLLPVVLLVALAGCAGTGGLVPADPSYATDVQPVFDHSCVGCHGAASPSGSYSLASRAGALGPGSDSIPNVIAGRADSSKLYRRLTGIETPRMPLGGAALDTVSTGTVRNWVNKGAKDN